MSNLSSSPKTETGPVQGGENRPSYLRLLLAGAAIVSLTILYIYFLSKDLVRPGGYDSGWTWGHRELDANSIPNLGTIIQVSVLAVFFIALAWISVTRLTRFARLATFLVLTGAICLSLGIYAGVTIEASYNFHIIPMTIVNSTLNGLFTDAIKAEGPWQIFTDYPRYHSTLTGHSVTHPPGNLFFFWFAVYLVSKIAALASLMDWFGSLLHINRDYLASIDLYIRNPDYYRAVILTGFGIQLINFLAIIPVYFVAKWLFDRRVGIISILLSMAIPAYHVMVPTNDQLYVFFGMAYLMLFLLAFRRDNVLLAVVSGIFLVVGIFFSIAIFLFIPISFLTVMFLLLRDEAIRSRSAIWKSARSSLKNRIFIWSTSTALFALLILGIAGINIIAISRAILDVNDKFNQGSIGVPHLYSFWIYNNLYDFFMFVGIPITILSAWLLFNRKQTFGHSGRLFAIGVFGFILLLDIIGLNRGEVARLWMFLIPFFVIVAAVKTDELAGSSSWVMILFVSLIVLMLIFQTTAFRMFLATYQLPALPFFSSPVTGSNFHGLNFLIP